MKWLALPVLLAASTAHADQCAYLSSDTAERARAIVAQHRSVIRFCEPCGDHVPGAPSIPATFERAAAARGEALVLDGTTVDLAYTYVQTSTHRYDNLAMLVGCPVSGVSPGLRVDDATDQGVLIVPDDTPRQRAPETPAPPSPTIIVQPAGLGWGAIAAGCGATSVLWLVALRLGRRRQHRPRLG